MPSHGQFVGGANKPWSETARKKGERQGLHWRIPASRGPRAVRHVLIDTNFWKSCIHQRYATPVGDRGSLSLWGRSGSVHRLFAEHQTAEYRVRVEARGRVGINQTQADPHGRAVLALPLAPEAVGGQLIQTLDKLAFKSAGLAGVLQRAWGLSQIEVASSIASRWAV